jgi:hypothetical protein
MAEVEARQRWEKDQPSNPTNSLDANQAESTLTMNSIKVIENLP